MTRCGVLLMALLVLGSFVAAAESLPRAYYFTTRFNNYQQPPLAKW